MGRAYQVAEKYDRLELMKPPVVPGHGLTRVAKALVKVQREAMKRRLRQKVIHGVFFKETEKPICDRKATAGWMRQGRLDASTEALLTAAQDGALHTRAYRARILKEGNPPNAGSAARRKKRSGTLWQHAKSTLSMG